MAATTADPRNIIKQEAFSVAPHLLGLPLARPSRRLVAILLDLLFLAILVHLAGGALLGLAAAYAFFRFASRALGTRGKLGPKARLAFRLMGSVILFFVALSAWEAVREGRIPFLPNVVVVRAGDSVDVSGGDAARIGPEVVALQNAATEAEGRRHAAAIVALMRATGSSDEQVRRTLEDAARGNNRPWMPAVVAAALATRPEPAKARVQPALAPDSLLHLYAAAMAAGDTAAVDSLRPGVTSLVAADTVAELREQVDDLRKERTDLARDLEKEREGGLLSSIIRLLDDLGIGFGWAGLYFTAFTALWKGQTPGKMLLGIRVVRLNGLPMTLWGAFERFGGYAAGLLTGLLGFAQVYWDRNRQAIHDKITETVVIRERKGQPLPAAPARSASAATLSSTSSTTRV